MNLTTNPDFSLKGTVEVPTFTDVHGNACFAGPLTIVSGQTEGISYARGVWMEIFANDSLGRTLRIEAWSINTDGTPAAIGEIYEPNQNSTMIKQAPMMNMSHCMRSVAAHAINLPGAVAHCIWSRNANVSNLTIGIATSTNQLTCHG